MTGSERLRAEGALPYWLDDLPDSGAPEPDEDAVAFGSGAGRRSAKPQARHRAAQHAEPPPGGLIEPSAADGAAPPTRLLDQPPPQSPPPVPPAPVTPEAPVTPSAPAPPAGTGGETGAGTGLPAGTGVDIAPVPDDGPGQDGAGGVAAATPTEQPHRPGPPNWQLRDDGRWVVGDAGSQPRTVAVPTRRPAGAPADTELDGALVGQVTYRAASLRGFSHQESGKPRQDAFAVRVTRSDRWLVACVADGVSDAARSETAARTAADTATRRLVSAVEDAPVPAGAAEWEKQVAALPWLDTLGRTNRALADRARRDFETLYRHMGDDAALEKLPETLPFADVRSHMATTAVVLVLAASPDPSGLHAFAVCVLAGDSAGYVVRDGRWRPVIALKDTTGALARNDVRALPSEAAPVVRFGRLRGGQAVALFSDGVSDPLGQGEGEVGRFLLDRWQSPPDLFQFGQHVGFYRKSFFDDRTAVVAWIPARPS